MALLRRPERGAPLFSVSGSRDGDGTQYGLYVGVAFIRTCVSSRVTCEGTYTALSTKEQGPQIAQEHRCSVSQRRPRSPWLSRLSPWKGPCQRPGEERISSSPSPKSATKCFSRSSISPSASSCASPSLSTMAATAPAE